MMIHYVSVCTINIGWVGQLAEYFGPDHQPLNLAAGKALANMDKNSRKYGIYDRSMYLFYPLYEDEDELSTKTSWKRKSVSTTYLFLEPLSNCVELEILKYLKLV